VGEPRRVVDRFGVERLVGLVGGAHRGRSQLSRRNGSK
jgi:hypothetical protein